MLTLRSLTFAGSVWSTPVFKKFKEYIEQQADYRPDSEEHILRGTSMDDLQLFQNLEEDEIEWFTDCNLLVDKEKINVSYVGLCEYENCYPDDKLIDEETGHEMSYWVDITIACGEPGAMVDLSDYPQLHYYLCNKDKYSYLVRQQVYNDAIARDGTGLIAREFADDFKPAEFKYYVKK